MPLRILKRVVIDTNIFVSYLIGKKLQSLTALHSSGELQLVVFDQLITQITTVTNRPKLQKYFPRAEVDRLLRWMSVFASHIQLSDQIPVFSRDPKDDYLVALSIASEADYLVTGDKDLLVLEVVGNTSILTYKEFEKQVSK